MERIQMHMKQLFSSYTDIVNTKNEKQFWDLVVLTAYDEVQKQSFEKQVADLYGATHLIKGKLHVIADPPNCKLGCGGSTLHVLKTLVASYGVSLYEKRVLIIHSGGSSQRLPSYTVQGKIFSPLPIQDLLTSGAKLSLMLDLKLALYLPFCHYLRPGIFVSCGDDIETYFLDYDSLSSQPLKTADVVALAHPCNLDTATGHGVYVLPDLSSTKTDSVIVSECLEVLQKPSIPLMRAKKAVVRNERDEDMVYSDSVFWMSEKAYRPLLSWYLTTSLDSELDAYGHFLPCLGVNMKNYSSEKFVDYRREILPILQNLDFKIIVLRESKFYHLGTMQEYLHNVTACQSFRKELNIPMNTTNCISHLFTNLKEFRSENAEENQPLTVFSYISKKGQIEWVNSPCSIVEWCLVDMVVRIPSRVILSNCVLRESVGVKFAHNSVSILGGFLYHTVPLHPHLSGERNQGTSYVTVAFEIDADVKRVSNDASEISIADVQLDRVMREGGLEEGQVLANGKPYSLWNLKLFRGSTTAEESFWRTHHFINKILHWRDGVVMETDIELPLDNDKNKLFSMKDISMLRDLDVFLKDRKKLLELIHDS